jgi:N-acetylmuramic acid 6-phosphate etherase
MYVQISLCTCPVCDYNMKLGILSMLTSATMQEVTGVPDSEITNNDPAALLQSLITESENDASQGLDTKSALDVARIINHEDAKVAGAVKKALPEIAQVIDQVARSLKDGGRLIYIGAGSSGRIAALDASECPPTYSTAPGQIQYIMAGGPKALASAVEVNEDSEELGQRDIARRRPTRKDVIIGISASGRTPYVVAAVAYARARGARTAAITCNHGTPISAAADISIVAEVGPEVISGSTRMKAGSAQKMILNMITTGAMTRMGYVYENLMVNVHMQNSKLVERGIRILMSACNIDREKAVQTIKSAGRSVPVALVMLKARVDKPEAVRRLARSDGNVRVAIEDNAVEI